MIGNSLKKYVEIGRVFVAGMENEIKNKGFTIGVANNVRYDNSEKLYDDIEKQLKKFIANGDLNQDISLESAMHIIKGTNPLE